MDRSSSPFFDRTAALIVAAGKGLRAGGAVPKQFAPWRGKPLVRHAVEALRRAGIERIAVVVPGGGEAVARDAIGPNEVLFVTGAETRQGSVRAGLEALSATAPDLVLIHDAARPDLPEDVVGRLIAALAQHPGAIPVLPVVDSVVRASDGLRRAAVERDGLFRVQTPQAFRFAEILAAHRAWTGAADAGDDAAVAEASGLSVATVAGDERLRKITFAADFHDDNPPVRPSVRTGTGFDVHRLVTGCPLWLCGVQIAHDRGLSGHSDADVAIHALVDALLGAVARGDIGDHFPPSDPQWKGAPSVRFLEHAATLVRESGYAIANVDVTIVCEAPRIGPHKAAMRARLAEILGIPVDGVSVKATTTERLGMTGRGEGIAAQAVATVVAAAD